MNYTEQRKEILLTPNGNSKYLRNNTYANIVDLYSFAIKYHNTNILTFYEDGRIVLNTDTWETVTTKERMNEWLPNRVYIYQQNYVWYITLSTGTVEYCDGMVIDRNGNLLHYPKKKRVVSPDEIKTFAKNYAKEFVSGNVPEPSGGDCWFCVGSLEDNEHLVSHIQERYYVPSMLVNAVEQFPTAIITKHYIGSIWQGKRDVPDFVEKEIYKLISKFLRRKIK